MIKQIVSINETSLFCIKDSLIKHYKNGKICYFIFLALIY